MFKKRYVSPEFPKDKLSEATKVDCKYIRRIERKNPPALKIDTIEKFAKALKVKLAQLLQF